jgi:pimeloyl-ACP methyl ester carboxylesterase
MVNDDFWQHGFYGVTPANLGTFVAEGVPATGRGLRADRMAGVVTLEECGHATNIDQPELTDAAILEFIR